MGSCQSKKNVKQPKKKVKQPQSPDNVTASPINDDKQDNESNYQPNDRPSSVNKAVEKLLDPRGSQFVNPLSDILEACFEGNYVLVQALIKKHELQDISNLKGFHTFVSIGNGRAKKVYDTTISWNPLLLAISQKHLTIVKLIFQQVPYFHKISCLSKPYSFEEQKKKVFSYEKRLKKENFSLKLAILNQDEQLFKFLWNDNRLLWNLGHFFLCLKYIVKNTWDAGVKLLFSSTTSKVLFMSVNDTESFIEMLAKIKEELQNYKDNAPSYYQKIKDCMFVRPYFLYCLFLEMYQSQNSADTSYLNKCMSKINQDDIQLKHPDIEAIFQKLDPKKQFASIKQLFDEKFKNKDKLIEKNLKKLAIFLEQQDFSIEDQDVIIQLVDDLDLYAFNQIQVFHKDTNCLIEVLDRGSNLEFLLDYCFDDSFVNIKAILRDQNKFEIQNEVTEPPYTGFFKYHVNDFKIFSKIYYYVIDMFQLRYFLDIFDEVESLQAFEFMLTDYKFRSLFVSSLEMQKYVFVKQTMELGKDFQADIDKILKKEPYAKYTNDIQKGYQGEDYQKLTIQHLKQQKEQKMNKAKQDEKGNHDSGVQETKFGQSLSIIKLKQTGQGQSPQGSDASIKKANKKVKQQDQSSDDSDGSSDISKNSSQDKAEPRESLGDMSLKNNNKQVMKNNLASTMIQSKTINLRESRESLGPKSQLSVVSRSNLKDSSRRLNIFSKQSTKNNNYQEQYEKQYTISPSQNDDEIGGNYETSSPQLQPLDSTQKQPYQFEIMKAAELQGIKEDFDKLPENIIESIKANDLDALKYLIEIFKITNVTWIKNTKAELIKKVTQRDSETFSNYSNMQKGMTSQTNLGIQQYQTNMWNPIHFAIYYKKIEIVQFLLNKYQSNFIMSIRMPPVNEFTEYIIPNQKNNYVSPEKQQPINQYLRESMQSLDQRFISPNTQRSQTQPLSVQYYPSSASVECFGIEIAIKNRDIKCLQYLWNDQNTLWDERHFAFVLDKVLEEHWDIGIGSIFRSQTSKIIFKALNAEDKDNFLSSKIIDKIVDSDYWQNNGTPTKITQQQTQIVISELQYEPYGSYAVIKFPKLFDEYGLLGSTLKSVKQEDIYNFIVARKENISHLISFCKSYQNNGKVQQALQSIVDKAKAIAKSQQKLPINPVKIVQLIKLGDLSKLKNYFDLDDNCKQLELLNQLQGYEDTEYNKMFENNVEFFPQDETISLIFSENSTADWNPLIYAIFYQKLDIVKYFCDNSSVYVRNCLTTPFIIEMEDDMDIDGEEMFIKEKTELVSLVICVMLQNAAIFKYLWEKCSYIWNDIHFILLTNYIFEGQWEDGVSALFSSPHTHQMFNSMNLYEKEKFLKFCDKSISKSESMTTKFRQMMSLYPYNVYYLPILATTEDLQKWDQDQSKENFFRSCHQHFDSKSFSILTRFNKNYVNEFISTAPSSASTEVMNFAKKLKSYKLNNEGKQKGN